MNKFENVYQDAALMRKVLLGEANEVEQQDLEKRLAECPDLQKVYGQLQNGETLRVAFGEYQNYSSKKAYQSFLQKIGRMEPKVQKRRSLRVWWWAAAAESGFMPPLLFADKYRGNAVGLYLAHSHPLSSKPQHPDVKAFYPYRSVGYSLRQRLQPIRSVPCR